MELLCEDHIANKEQFLAGNGQEIRELILRRAVKTCENYATDVLVLLEGRDGESIAELFSSPGGFINIYFRTFGVDWAVNSMLPTDRYQYRMVLCKGPDSVQLYGGVLL